MRRRTQRTLLKPSVHCAYGCECARPPASFTPVSATPVQCQGPPPNCRFNRYKVSDLPIIHSRRFGPKYPIASACPPRRQTIRLTAPKTWWGRRFADAEMPVAGRRQNWRYGCNWMDWTSAAKCWPKWNAKFIASGTITFFTLPALWQSMCPISSPVWKSEKLLCSRNRSSAAKW